MKRNRIISVAMSLALILSLCLNSVVFAVDYGIATKDTIDTSAKGSIEIHKYDISATQKAGVSVDGYIADGKKNTIAEETLSQYSIQGVVFTYLQVADIYTYSNSTDTGVNVQVLYGFTDTKLLSAIGLNADDAILVKDGKYYYSSTMVSDSLSNLLENKNTDTKNMLEDYITTNGGTNLPETSATGVTSADNLNVGLYLIVETYVPEDVTYTTDPFFVSIPSTTNDGDEWNYDLVVYPKNQTDYPTLDKTVADDDEYSTDGNNGHKLHDTAIVSKGDTADFRFVSKLPAILSKASYLTKYTFDDVMDKGLTYNEDSVKISWYSSKADAEINNTSKAAATWDLSSGKFTATFKPVSEKNSMTIAMTAEGLKAINPSYSGYYVVVSYTATVNNEILLGDEGNSNNVTLTYSRSNTNYEETLEDKAVVYSYGLDLTKTFSDGKGDATKVEFVLKNTSAKTDDVVAPYYVLATKAQDGVYNITGETRDENNATVFSPASDGTMIIYGTQADTYDMVEISTDDGYTLLKDAITIQIQPTVAEITASQATVRGEANANNELKYTLTKSASATVDKQNATMLADKESENAIVKLSIENNKRFPIPATGGTGTFIVTVFGMVLALFGLGFGRKKKSKESEL